MEQQQLCFQPITFLEKSAPLHLSSHLYHSVAVNCRKEGVRCSSFRGRGRIAPHWSGFCTRDVSPRNVFSQTPLPTHSHSSLHPSIFSVLLPLKSHPPQTILANSSCLHNGCPSCMGHSNKAPLYTEQPQEQLVSAILARDESRWTEEQGIELSVPRP